MSAVPQQPFSSFLPRLAAGERRRDDRIDSTVKVSVRRDRSHEWLDAVAIDLCEDGVQLNSVRPMTPGEYVMLHLEVVMPQTVFMGFDARALVVSGPPTIHSLCMPARVVRAQPDGVRGWNLGVQLTDSVSDDDRNALRGFLDFLVSGE